MFSAKNQQRCRDGSPGQVDAWKKLWKKFRNKEGYTMSFQKPSIRQLQGTLDTYFTIPTSGNIRFSQLGYYSYFRQNATVTFITEATALQSEVQCTHVHVSTLL